MLRHKSLHGQLIPSRKSDDGRRKPVDASKRKRIVRSGINKPSCSDISWRNKNVKRRGS
jgi:hypothetical protein